MSEESKFMSLREYAKHRDVSLYSVQYAIKSGKVFPVTDDKGRIRIDVEETDRKWHPNKDPSVPKRKDSNKEQAQIYYESRAKKEKYEAELRKLEYEIRTGKWLAAEEVKKQAFQSARRVRDAFLNLPNRVSSVIAAESDQYKVHEILSEEVQQIIDEVVDAGKKAIRVQQILP